MKNRIEFKKPATCPAAIWNNANHDTRLAILCAGMSKRFVDKVKALTC